MHWDFPGKPVAEFRREIDDVLAGKSPYHRPADRFDFSGFMFPEAQFRRSTFPKPVECFSARFYWLADFYEARFSGEANFENVVFDRGANFASSQFNGRANFFNATFVAGANFAGAWFVGDATFGFGKFLTEANFSYCRFDGGASFSAGTFERSVNFAWANFGPTRKDKTAIEEPKRSPAILDLAFASFHEAGGVMFYQANGSSLQGLLLRVRGCDVEHFKLDDVNWYRLGNRLTLQDEIDLPREANAVVGGSHEPVAISYRQLIKNFEGTRHFLLAEDCFCGAMDMRRRDPRNFWFSGRASFGAFMKKTGSRAGWVRMSPL